MCSTNSLDEIIGNNNEQGAKRSQAENTGISKIQSRLFVPRIKLLENIKN